jgi:ferric-dicitrate binding protein FerR (iron transport regulator)
MTCVKVSSYIVLLAALIVLSSCSNVNVETTDNFEVVELPDGSIVYLNHNSAISYDEEFSPRTVDIKGEIFLSVTERETPLIVNTDMGEITVLGTEFNVKSDLKEIEVEVEEGIVELKTKGHSNKVKRGEVAVYKEGENVIQKGKAEFKFKIWISDLKREFKKLGKEIRSSSKEIGKESKEAGKELKKELKKLKIK